MKPLVMLPLEKLIPTRYSLLSRLQDWDDQESWKDFFDTYWNLIYSLAIKSGLSPAEAEDVVQETVISVAKAIHKFKRDRSQGTFKGWLRNIIQWRIADQFQKRSRVHRDEASEDAVSLAQIPDSGAGLEAVWEQEWQRNLFEAAVQRVKRRIKEEHFQIFDLYVVKGWPVAKVAKRVGVSIGQVYLAKHRVSVLVKKEVGVLERTPF